MAADPRVIVASMSAEQPDPRDDGRGTGTVKVATGTTSPDLSLITRQRRVTTAIPASLRHTLIEEAAYRRAQARGFITGHELDDWLEAEIEVDTLIRERYR